jgi:hypothetical protein
VCACLTDCAATRPRRSYFFMFTTVITQMWNTSFQFCFRKRQYIFLYVAWDLSYCPTLVTEWSFKWSEIVAGKLQGYKFSDVGFIPELFQAGRKALHVEAHQLIIYVFNPEELWHKWNQQLFVPVSNN